MQNAPGWWACKDYDEVIPSDRELLVSMLDALNEFSKSNTCSSSMADLLLRRFGNLHNIFAENEALGKMIQTEELPVQFLEEVGRIKGFVRSILRSQIESKTILDNLDAVKRYCRGMLFDQRVEPLLLLLMDSHFKLTKVVTAQTGTINHVTIYPREILRHALNHDAHQIILVHNHPTGQAYPSVQDILLTQKLADICQPIGIGLADHIITVKNTEFSFRETGLLAAP